MTPRKEVPCTVDETSGFMDDIFERIVERESMDQLNTTSLNSVNEPRPNMAAPTYLPANRREPNQPTTATWSSK